MRTRVAMFRGENEAMQFDLIHQMCGSPGSPELMQKYRSLPDWEKMNFNRQYPSKLQSSYVFSEPTANGMLEDLLCLDPDKRITATKALTHPYFTQSAAPEADE